MPKATLFVPSLVALLLSCSALSSTAQAGWFSSDSKPAAPAAKTDDKAKAQPGTNLEDSIRQAQMLRLAGSYSEAINHLSQLMLVAADDSRVISEYGKTLAAMGRADEAEKFLSRAQELQPNDWTIYSALGVANDQIGNQKEAQVNYEHALALKPGEPSVLSNYALSRMLAKDPAMASRLADRAEIANAAAHDDEIARNIAMIRSMAPDAKENVAASTAAPGTIVPPVSAPVPHMAVATAPLAPIKPAQPAPTVAQAQPQKAQAQASAQAPRGVVMQPVPVDPLAGPVAPKTAVATHEPRSLQPVAQAGNEPASKSEPSVKAVAKADAPKPAAVTQVKPVPPKPEAVAQAKPVPAAPKPQAVASVAIKPPAQAKPAPAQQAKNEPAKPVVTAAKVSLPVKAADVKPAAAQPAVVKAADAKPQDAKAKTASKDAIPGLRLSANAY